MPSKPFVVLAQSPDGDSAVIGPVFSAEAAVALAEEIAAAGWVPDGVRRHLTRSAFRGRVAGTSAPAFGANPGDTLFIDEVARADGGA